MGQSTDAILFYGICFDEDETPECFEEDYSDWGDDWAEKHGPKKPKNEDYHTPEWDKWREEKSKFEENGIAVDMGMYCSLDYPMYFVAPTAHTHTVSRGYYQEITPEMLQAPREDQIAALKEFCELHNIPYSEPKWFLVSYWG